MYSKVPKRFMGWINGKRNEFYKYAASPLNNEFAPYACCNQLDYLLL